MRLSLQSTLWRQGAATVHCIPRSLHMRGRRPFKSVSSGRGPPLSRPFELSRFFVQAWASSFSPFHPCGRGLRQRDSFASPSHKL